MPELIPMAYRYSIRVVTRALQVLEALGEEDLEHSLTDLSKRTRVGKGSLHRLLATLEERMFVRQDPVSLKYSLGTRVLQLGLLLANRSSLIKVAVPRLEALVDLYGQAANLAVLDGLEILYLAKRESPEPLRITVEAGRRVPAHCTALGKALLAYQPEAELRKLLRRRRLPRFTSRTIVDPRQLLRHLEGVRAQGVAYDSEELIEGLRCVGAPIFDHTGQPVGAISVSGLVSRLPDERITEIGKSVKERAAEISRDLGFGFLGLATTAT